MKSIVLFAVLAFALGSALSFRLDRIIGGATAEPGQFPYQVSVRGRNASIGENTFRHRCGGTLLSDRWVVTTAQCTLRGIINVTDLAIVVGAHHVANDGQLYEVEEVIRHENHTNQKFNNIALVKTVRPIELSSTVRPIPLEGSVVGGGVQAVVSGWGATHLPGDIEPPVFPEHLQFINVTTLTNERCIELHEPAQAQNIYNGTICTFDRPQHGTCFGDGGSTLSANGKLIGLVAWGVPCAIGRPDQYTRISFYLDWIRNSTGIAPEQ